nr:RNA-directed DNA polymerase, eukaryota, reverse transcriptase zinc-binding domain protein [Tanacetum cinerariifolium]
NHLVGVLGSIVNEVQSAFVADRQILDGPFILDEVLHWCRGKKKHTLIFKVDFEKANASVRWDFVDDKFGFGERWRTWIQSCLSSSRGSILVKDAGLFTGIKINSMVNLSYLFYADDAIFLGQWSELNIDSLVRVLEYFFRASGPRINMCKSKIMGVNVEDGLVRIAAAKLGCLILKTPFIYFCTKVGGNMSRKQSWKEVVDKVLSRLSRWKMNLLSIGGRFTLLKSVLGSMPIFHMSIFKDKGGLGVSSLYALNRGLMIKGVWRFYFQKNSLWTKVIKAIYGEDGNLNKVTSRGVRTCWSSIVQEVRALH